MEKVARGLSAGRVQSVAVRLITEREKEIKAFEPEEYWDVQAEFKAGETIKSKLTKFDGSALDQQVKKKQTSI